MFFFINYLLGIITNNNVTIIQLRTSKGQKYTITSTRKIILNFILRSRTLGVDSTVVFFHDFCFYSEVYFF